MIDTKEPALVIMAAGIGSRYGGGIKQLEAVGEHGEIIMDYSVHDAIQAGFRKIIFVIRRAIEKDFREIIGNRMEKLCEKAGVECRYAFQEMDALPEGFSVPEGRTKPWGTGQAVLSCKEFILEPFAVINADDYYGKEAFGKLYRFLKKDAAKNSEHFCMAGFILKNTLSDNGGVTRGICQADARGYLQKVCETTGIVKTAQGAEADGVPLDPESIVSMNMWGLTPEFVGMLETGFREFLENLGDNQLKKEFLLPIYIDELLQKGKVSVKVLPTNDQWFGVTYHEDKASVAEAFAQLSRDGVYLHPLFGDLFLQEFAAGRKDLE